MSSNIHPLQVSSQNRPAEVQQWIDESFNVRTLPLHEAMFRSEVSNYAYWGQTKDYTFENGTLTGIKASKILEEFVEKKKFSVLELGCGVGGFLHHLKEQFPHVEVMGVTAADFRASARYNGENIQLPNEEYTVGNLENIQNLPSLKGKKFDVIVASTTFRHLSDPLGVICQAYDLLNENGILLVDDFELNGIDGDDYRESFSEAGCTNVEIYTYGHRTCQTKIRKVGLDHLSLPIRYDLSKSTRADAYNQAHIFYLRDKKKINWLSTSNIQTLSVASIVLAAGLFAWTSLVTEKTDF